MSILTCLWPDCERTNIFARGLCQRCNMRARRAGVLDQFEAPPRVCDYCDSEFRTGKNGKHSYCSIECQTLYVNARRISSKIQKRAANFCSQCGDWISLTQRSDAGFCGDQCQKQKWYQDNPEWVQAKAQWQGVFNAERKRVVSREWYENNRERVYAANAAWRGSNPEKVLSITRKSAQKRRAVKRSAFVESFSIEEIFARDNGKCWICSSPVDNSLAYPDPMSKSLDHKVPLARGGKHSRSNAGLSHLVCNMRKGAKLIDVASAS